MSSVSDVTTAGGGVLTKNLGGGAVMGKDDFLKLLVTQLKNQDPLKPQDPTEFTAQLAQFSSLEQLFAVNESLEKMAAGSAETERLSALSMIGKEVVSEGGRLRYSGEPLNLGYRLDTPAHEVSLHVLDDSGRNLASSGLDGNQLAAGEYQLVVKAVDANEEATPASALVKSTITGLEMAGGQNKLVSAAGDFLLKDIVSVRDI
jgi:flagellar basal-body rod modification protein FlgD